MQFILTSGWEDGVAELTQRLVNDLAKGRKVLWLVSGGSNIPASVQVMGDISATLSRGLSVMLADERYGPPGHADSNWNQLLKAGFRPGQATLLPILEDSLTLAETASRYEQLADQAFASADIVVAQLGIGDDGHIAGILPGSSAATEATALVAAYHSRELDRLTLTFTALKRVNVAFAFAFGATKRAALAALQQGPESLVKQPSQILKQLREAYVYNDQVGETT